MQSVNVNNGGVIIEISIKCVDNICTVYDDRKGNEIGTCDYSKACNVLNEHLKCNKNYHFGLWQKTLRDLNINAYKKNVEEKHTIEKAQDSFRKQKYFNARRTSQEDAELRREMLRENNKFRRQEREVIETNNGTKIQVNTKSIK